MTDKELKYNITGKLKKIAKQLAKNYTVKVGILAEDNEPISPDFDTAALGALQEFGADIKITKKMAAFLHLKAKELGLSESNKKGDGYVHIPARSWLYEPIVNGELLAYIKQYIGDSKLFEELAQKEDYKKLANIIGEVCLLQIQKAFENSGINGEWDNNSPLTIAGKGSSKPLIDKGNLRKIINFEVEER